MAKQPMKPKTAPKTDAKTVPKMPMPKGKSKKGW